MARVLLISGEGAKDRDVLDIVESSSSMVVSSLKSDKLQDEATSDASDLVIVNVSGLSDYDIDLLSNLRALMPEVPVIVVSPQLSSAETRRLFKFNIHDWLPSPVKASDLIESINKGVRSRAVNHNKVHAVVSCVGGAGATTLALSMADIAATQLHRKQSIALFDLDFSLGDCGYAVNMVNGYNLAKVAANPRRVDQEFIRVIQQQYDSRFYLYSFKQPELNSEVNGYELVLRLLDAVTSEHDHTFLDIPYYESEWKGEVLAAVNSCTLVAELNLPSIKHAIDNLERVRKLRGPNFPVRVVFNKWESSLFGQRISKRKVRELLDGTPFQYMPMARSQIGQALDRGITPSDVAKKSKFTRALRKYMKGLELAEAKA